MEFRLNLFLILALCGQFNSLGIVKSHNDSEALEYSCKNILSESNPDLEKLIAQGKFNSQVSLIAKEDKCNFIRVDILYTDSEGTTYLYAEGRWQSKFCELAEAHDVKSDEFYQLIECGERDFYNGVIRGYSTYIDKSKEERHCLFEILDHKKIGKELKDSIRTEIKKLIK